MAQMNQQEVNEFEGNCKVAWTGEEQTPKIMAVPVMDDSNKWYHPKCDLQTGKIIYTMPKILARHCISTQPDRWKLLGEEKMLIRVLNRKDGSYDWVDFYPWEWKLVSTEADPHKSGEFIKTFDWVENKNAK